MPVTCWKNPVQLNLHRKPGHKDRQNRAKNELFLHVIKQKKYHKKTPHLITRIAGNAGTPTLVNKWVGQRTCPLDPE